MTRAEKRAAAKAATLDTVANSMLAAEVAPAEVAPATILPLWLSAILASFAGSIGSAYAVICTGYATSPARVKYSITGRGDAIVAVLSHFVTLPLQGSLLNLYPTDTEVPGHTLHYAGANSVGHTYRLSGHKGTWVFRGTALAMLGTVPPAMLLCDVPLLGDIRTANLTTPEALKTPHGLTVHSAILEVVAPVEVAPVAPVVPDAT